MNPKVIIECVDGKWLVTNKATYRQQKIFSIWRQLEGYLKDALTEEGQINFKEELKRRLNNRDQ